MAHEQQGTLFATGVRFPPGTVWTTRYANGRLLGAPGTNLVAVRITLGAPRFPLGYPLSFVIEEMYPDPRTFHLSAAAFEAVFRRKLEHHGVGLYLERFDEIRAAAEADGVIGAALALCCFENVLAGEDCHRRMFARWLNEKTGLVVPELPAGGAGDPRGGARWTTTGWPARSPSRGSCSSRPGGSACATCSTRC